MICEKKPLSFKICSYQRGENNLDTQDNTLRISKIIRDVALLDQNTCKQSQYNQRLVYQPLVIYYTGRPFRFDQSGLSHKPTHKKSITRNYETRKYYTL